MGNHWTPILEKSQNSCLPQIPTKMRNPQSKITMMKRKIILEQVGHGLFGTSKCFVNLSFFYMKSRSSSGVNGFKGLGSTLEAGPGSGHVGKNAKYREVTGLGQLK